MVSVVSICNTALSHIGKATISDINEQSEEANQCKLHYGLTRDTMLQGFNWQFANRKLVLAEVSNPWPERWERAYTRPTDCLKPIRIIPEVDPRMSPDEIPYETGEGLIFTSQAAAKLEYTRLIDDPARFPPLFLDALCWALATKICLPLTKDQSLRKDAFQIAAQTLGAAQTADANEQQDTYDYPSALVRARG